MIVTISHLFWNRKAQLHEIQEAQDLQFLPADDAAAPSVAKAGVLPRPEAADAAARLQGSCG